MKIFVSFFALTLFISCNRQNNSEPPINKTTEPDTIPALQAQIHSSVDDPTFVETQDTISAYGPRSITRNVLQDKNGIYWFTTWQGIIRYDGKLFTNITLQGGLRHFHFFSVLEDKTGKLWFGTIGGGAYRYDAHQDGGVGQGKNFTLFTTAEHLVGNVVLCIQDDNAGNIWFGTDKGVSRYNGNTFTNFTKQDGLSDNFVSAILQDKNGKLWFGTNDGVNCYDGGIKFMNGKVFTNFTNKKEDWSFHNVRSIIEDQKGNIWIGSGEGLFRYNPVSGEFTNITKNFIGCIFEDKKGNIWLSEGKANSSSMVLSMYDGKSVTNITESQQVFGITQDMNGNLWFGTANGVCHYDGKSISKFEENVSTQKK